MTDYSQPVSASDLGKAKTWYDIVCWGGLLIVLLPVGIANVILGYMMGDSPCTLCWGQREEMAFIGVVALFMVRYGFILPSAIWATTPPATSVRGSALKSWAFTRRCGRKSSSGAWWCSSVWPASWRLALMRSSRN